jgi:hypothetical protein
VDTGRIRVERRGKCRWVWLKAEILLDAVWETALGKSLRSISTSPPKHLLPIFPTHIAARRFHCGGSILVRVARFAPLYFNLALIADQPFDTRFRIP